ncbi:MAG: 6-carboxytetrahydropterin synthase QueD [Alphaproteobacteria bacterium]|nr:6-carboxytetrahydropterin synthase QueD [Alphaproteobacteria bacterium]
MITLSKTFTIEAAHYLPERPNPHGHSYEVEVWVKGDENSDYVIGEAKFDQKASAVVSQLDHRVLNDVIPVPTTENIARWIWNNLESELSLFKVVVRRPTIKMACEYYGGNYGIRGYAFTQPK